MRGSPVAVFSFLVAAPSARARVFATLKRGMRFAAQLFMHSLQLRLRRRRLAGARGYSLLEILVVLAIIALLSSVIGIAVYQHLLKARIEATRQSALKIRQTVVLYKMDHAGGDDCPNADELKKAELIDSASKLTDAWDKPFAVTCGDRGEVHVASGGPDKKMGTEDDIVAPEPPTKVASTATP